MENWFKLVQTGYRYLELFRFSLECVDGDNLLEPVEANQDERVVKFRSESLRRRHLGK